MNKPINPKGGRNRREKKEVTIACGAKYREVTTIWENQIEVRRVEVERDIKFDAKALNLMAKIAEKMRETADRIDGGQNPEQTSEDDGFDPVD